MPRDPRKLRVFTLADTLVPKIYAVTLPFPPDEKVGLIAQIYLLRLSARLRMIPQSTVDVLSDHAGHVAASLTALIESLDNAKERAPEPRSRRKPRA